MIPWELLDSTRLPGDGGEMRLYRRGDEFSIRVDGLELMNSRAFGTEEALADLACGPVRERPCARVLVGGLGMGFTLAAASRALGDDAWIDVVEVVPSVVEWVRGPMAELASSPLDDPRAHVVVADVADVLREASSVYDAILLDVDNGPEGLTLASNDWLYGGAGLRAAWGALRPGGVLAVWSASSDRDFTVRLRRARFTVEEFPVRARGSKGARHHVWRATRGRR